MMRVDHRARWLAAEKKWKDYSEFFAIRWEGKPVPAEERRECQRREQEYCDAIRQSELHGDVVFCTEEEYQEMKRRARG